MKRKSKTYDVLNMTRIEMVKKYIDNHCHQELRLAEVAGLVNVAPITLCHLFKAYEGTTISACIANGRIQKASEMLLTTDEMVIDICYHCGYSTLSCFNRQFKKLNGCTPTEYRLQNKY